MWIQIYSAILGILVILGVTTLLRDLGLGPRRRKSIFHAKHYDLTGANSAKIYRALDLAKERDAQKEQVKNAG